ncbi:ABC transporter ATP-binding protein [Arthrobacter sp. zg-Y20]|uniref:ABC transporter ATP-binding protein n=1 Tax=unclassified Arthrobacter TaxID=235627 RepID=UPI001D13E85D|nr:MULTISPECIES: ABC transporter ATP-binding protein [unclassified Arthrobacter]MCC3274629.1 ABC transporter ATP-binding protein [Arthrobacter sp. zg-Y20]MDK1314786.1 ABC transporter ATP-binding protein [Arthrobacter sp. zg.Y20]WIB04650.1 ABC transporter ATP-binding protein [Arthrobacter sp. zg-Y20]
MSHSAPAGAPAPAAPAPAAPAAPAALELQAVTLEYPDGGGTLKALDNVDLRVPRGQILSLVGPSGSGKSSLLAVAATLIAPTSGTVTVAGTDVGDLNDAGRTALRRSGVGIVFQQPNLLASLTAAEQLVITDRLRGKAGPASERRALELLELVGLAHEAGKRPHQLSGGQRQRVNIARALMGSPSLLLVDEPTAALDTQRSESIVQLLVKVTREFGLGTVMVTHDTGFVPLTDAVAGMVDGRLGAPAHPESL